MMPRPSLDLLDLRVVRSLVHRRWFPTAFQILTLAAFLLLGGLFGFLTLRWGLWDQWQAASTSITPLATPSVP